MTIKDLCEMLVAKGECREYEPVKIGNKTYCNHRPSACKICNKAIKKYWKGETEND